MKEADSTVCSWRYIWKNSCCMADLIWVELSRSHMHVCTLRYARCVSIVLSIDALEGAIIIFTLMRLPAAAISCRWAFCCGINVLQWDLKSKSLSFQAMAA